MNICASLTLANVPCKHTCGTNKFCRQHRYKHRLPLASVDAALAVGPAVLVASVAVSPASVAPSNVALATTPAPRSPVASVATATPIQDSAPMYFSPPRLDTSSPFDMEPLFTGLSPLARGVPPVVAAAPKDYYDVIATTPDYTARPIANDEDYRGAPADTWDDPLGEYFQQEYPDPEWPEDFAHLYNASVRDYAETTLGPNGQMAISYRIMV